MRKMLLIIGLLLLIVIPVFAKGPVDRIIVTGPTLDEELILTDTAVIHPLSMAMLEDFLAGALDEPEDAGDVYYELERQYERSADNFVTFDRVRYYPTGYVFYVGIENGWSEYDDKWFYAKPEAEIAMVTALNLDAAPYVVLMNASGQVVFLDPQSLTQAAAAQMNTKMGRVTHFVDALDTSSFYFSEQATNGEVAFQKADMADRKVCATDTMPESMDEQVGIAWVVGDITSHNADVKGTPYQPIGVTTDARVLLHYPGQDFASGILVLSMSNNRQIDQWLPDHWFTQVITGNDFLYALETLPDQTLLYKLNARDGELLGTRVLESDVQWVGFGQFDLSDVGDSLVELQPCGA